MRKLMMPALLAGTMANAPRGVFAAPRADAENPKVLFASLNAAFEEFKTTHAESIAAKDVVTTEKLDRINTALSDLEAAMALQARKLEAAATIGTGGRIIPDTEYSQNFTAYARGGGEAIQASLKKTPDSDGGYLAPIEWDRTITDKLKIVSPGRSVFGIQTVTGQGFRKVFNLRGQASGWVGETAARPESGTSAFGVMTYNFGELYANPAITQQMLDDAEVDVETWLAGEVDTEFGFQESVAFISGSGVDRPTGLLTYVTGGANAAVHPFGSVKLTASANAALLNDAQTIINLIYGLPTELGQNASFIANRNTIKVIRSFKDGQGNYLWQPNFQSGEPATIAGYKSMEYAAMPDIAANSVPVLFGDFSRGYGIFDRKGTTVLRDPFTNKPFVHFYTTKRVGGGLLNPEFIKGVKIQLAALDF